MTCMCASQLASHATTSHAGVEGTSYEIAIVVMGSYLAYLVAEVAGTVQSVRLNAFSAA